MWPTIKILIALGLVGLALWASDRRFCLVGRFLSEKRSALDLAVVRIVIFGLLVGSQPHREFLAYANLDRVLLAPPFPLGHLMRFLLLSAGLANLAYGLMWIGGLCAAAGLFYRWTAPVATLAGLYLYTLPQLWGSVEHKNMHILTFAAILCLSPAADAFSLDKWRNKGQPPQPPLQRSLRYGLPVTAMIAIIALAYLFPGLWKVMNLGTAWFSAENMRRQAIQVLLQGPPTALQLWAIRQTTLLWLGSFFAIGFEVGFLFLVLSKKTRPLAVLAGLLFHSMTLLIMGISFVALMLAYVVFVDWTALVQRMGWVREEPSPECRRDPGTALRRGSAALVSAIFLMGVAHKVGAWPVACYPAFDAPPPASARVVEIEVTGSDGQRTTDDLTFDRSLGRIYGDNHWREMASLDKYGRMAPARARALIALWRKAHGVQQQVTVEFYDETLAFDDTQTVNPDDLRVAQRRYVGTLTY